MNPWVNAQIKNLICSLFKCHGREPVGIYFKNSFTAPGFMAATGDFDNDGALDLYCPGGDYIFLNNGAADFVPISNIGLPNTSSDDPRCASLADIDNDGDLDIISTHKDGHNVLLQNDLLSSNCWIKVTLKRANGQIGPFGSKILVYVEGHIGENNYLLGFSELASQQGYLAQNQPTIHFGLADAEAV